MTDLLLSEMGFKEIAVHQVSEIHHRARDREIYVQEAYAATFSAGMSTACVVDMGAQVTSVTCVDEGVVSADTR